MLYIKHEMGLLYINAIDGITIHKYKWNDDIKYISTTKYPLILSSLLQYLQIYISSDPFQRADIFKPLVWSWSFVDI